MFKNIVAILSIIFLFLFLRFYKINDSFMFFNDMGRDMLTLQTWHNTGKVPLLGPQTSALPFNQSPIYFYLLYPMFLLTHQSPYTSLFVNAILYLSSFIFCLFLITKYKTIITKRTIYITFLLISIHPQYIIQSRYVWNPSFITPFLLPSLLAFCLLTKKYSRFLLWTFALGLTASLSLSYSVAPLCFVIFITSFFLLKKHLVPVLLSLTISLITLNLPLIFFEFRHHFLLTSALLSKGSLSQVSTDFSSKLNRFLNFSINFPNYYLNLSIVIVIVVSCLYLITKSKNNFPRLISLLLLSTLILTLITPVIVQAHYIFGILILIFLLISLSNSSVLIMILIPVLFFYLSPTQLSGYFKPSPRTYQQMVKCFDQVCDKYSKPIFVTVQSSFHPYHNGPEHRYLLKKSGCNVQEIETNPNLTSTMALVVDGGQYDSIGTKFHELDIFGPSQITDQFSCQSNFKVIILTKK